MTNQKVQELAASYQRKLRTRVAEHRREMGVEDAPTEPIDIEEMWTAEPSKELAPIYQYDPKNDWRKRSWQLEGRNDWELWVLAALKLRHINAVENEVAMLEKDPKWLLHVPAKSARVFHFDADIIAKAGVL